MEYPEMICPFKVGSFRAMTKAEAKEYFDWYTSQIEDRISVLQQFILDEGVELSFDRSVDSLIPLWKWFQTKIQIVPKTPEELEMERRIYPEWVWSVHEKTKISLETQNIAIDVSLYFAEVVIKNSNGKVKWSYFTKPKNRSDVNEPVLLGFKRNMDLNPRVIAFNCAYRSSRKTNDKGLFEAYHAWMKDVEE